jgi:serine/threonine protein kinase
MSGTYINSNSIYIQERMLEKRCGTLPYIAPEVLMRPYHAEPADVWSCGIILVTMLAGGECHFSYLLGLLGGVVTALLHACDAQHIISLKHGSDISSISYLEMCIRSILNSLSL